MALRLLQMRDRDGRRRLAAAEDEGAAYRVDGVDSLVGLARAALREDAGLAAAAASRAGEPVDVDTALAEGRVLAPVDHADPAHLLVSGTGLTHLGSAEGRDKMHAAARSGEGLTDSMRMFLMGLEGGKPQGEVPGAQPEWFYKGDGSILVGPTDPMASPAFALDGGEEPEIAGVYLIDDDGAPVRLGYCLANEFSDHVTERGNYLWLAHSKLRQAALGPELLTGPLPAQVEGVSRIMRDGEVLWQAPFRTGEGAMSHSLANLEHHHFKYDLFRRPGDVHVHFFGTGTLSFSDGVSARPGDVFEIGAAPFRWPLRNRLAAAAPARAAVRAL